MSVDRIANMISTLKNAAMSGKAEVEVFHTRECEEISKILKEKGFLSEVKVFKPKETSVKRLHLELAKDDEGQMKISNTKRISKPGRRVYVKSSEIKRVAGGFGVMILSTPKGVLDGLTARKKKVGGEIICEVF
jgi:small subunit ribosomal protein S8